MKLAPHIPIERCRLVKYDFINDVVDQELDNVSISYCYNLYFQDTLPFFFHGLLMFYYYVLYLVSASNYWRAYGCGWILWIIPRNL